MENSKINNNSIDKTQLQYQIGRRRKEIASLDGLIINVKNRYRVNFPEPRRCKQYREEIRKVLQDRRDLSRLQRIDRLTITGKYSEERR